jgi:transposase InsO family protein
MDSKHSSEKIQRDVVATIESLHVRTAISRRQLLVWAGLQRSRYTRWQGMHTKRAETRFTEERPPLCHQILPEEKQSIIAYATAVRRSGRCVSHRILTYEMLDRDVAAVSESTTVRVLQEARAIPARVVEETRHGKGFIQPLVLHEHWHTDISYLWEFGYRAYLISVLEGRSRAVLYHKVMTSMMSRDVELVLQYAQELYPQARPRLITDNGGQFVSMQFKGFLAGNGFTHVGTSRAYPQSNGKVERQFRTTKETLRELSVLSYADLVTRVGEVVRVYNNERYHSALGYVTPMDVLMGRDEGIKKERQMKREEAQERRRIINSQFNN